MNTKWYIRTLIIILALIGLNQEQTKVANQQIVLQFTDVEMASAAAFDDTLATITEKLRSLGIVNIQIIETGDRHVSIRYYSDVDALSVEEFLSHNSKLSLTNRDLNKLPVDLPTDKLPETCSIVVSDLHQQTDDGLGLNGKLAFELKQEYNRFSNPVITPFCDAMVVEQDVLVQVAFKINRLLVITIDTTSDTIPEVRAGPSLASIKIS